MIEALLLFEQKYIIRLIVFEDDAEKFSKRKKKYSGTLIYESPNEFFKIRAISWSIFCFELRAKIQVTGQLQIPHH